MKTAQWIALVFAFVLFSPLVKAQEMTAEQVLDKAIAFHDPEGKWPRFEGTFYVNLTYANGNERRSQVSINLPKEYFGLITKRDEVGIHESIVKGEDYSHSLVHEGNDEEMKAKYPADKARFIRMRDYYTYLYGLPMKLKDPGTLLDPVVQKKTFKGKEYLVLKVTYEQEVGEDTWYFYFDPKTYAMEVYQFYHDESKNDGEYILLSGMETINGIHMPKKRDWYYNKDEAFLGSDLLMPIKQ